MRIAIDLSGIHEQTGVRVYAAQLLRELQILNTTHEFVVIMRDRDSAIYPIHNPAFQRQFIPSSAEGALSNLAWHWNGFSRLLDKWGIDMVHQLDCNRIFPQFRRPLVVTVHGLIDPAVPGRRHFLRQTYNSRIVPFLLGLPTRLISVSHNTKRDLLRYTSVREDKITVIHEGCELLGDDNLDKETAQALLEKEYGLKGDFILYVARLEHPNKNHVSLLKAYDILRRSKPSASRLVFVGGDSYRADAVRRAVAELSLENHVTMTGFVPDEHLPAFYRAARVYACPTLYEGFGLPLLEAMQFGVPIVCSDSSSLPELVGSAALKFDPNDIPAIAAALHTALSDNAVRNRLSRDGFAQVKTFNANEMARRTMDVYKETLLPAGRSSKAVPEGARLV